MSNDEIVEYIKKLTIADLIELVCNNTLITKSKPNKNVYTTEKVLEEYPMLNTRYKLDKAIKEQNLPFYREGHQMYFEKSLLDKWVEQHTSTYHHKKNDKYRL